MELQLNRYGDWHSKNDIFAILDPVDLFYTTEPLLQWTLHTGADLGFSPFLVRGNWNTSVHQFFEILEDTLREDKSLSLDEW